MIMVENENVRTIQPVILDQNYIHLKNLIIKAERRILKELGFCVHIKHPHKIIVMYLQVLGYHNHQKLMQYSWNYMNDSLRTDVFVRYQPETVACACIYLTARKLKLPLPKNPAWYTIFGAVEEEIRDISLRILRLYCRPKPEIEALEKKVEDLCRQYQEAKAKVRGSGNNTPNDNSPRQKTTGAHNAWGGFISRSGSHTAPPPITEKRSRSRSVTRTPENKHRKKSKKHRSRSRSPSRNYKKSHKRKSYSRSRSNSPHSKTRKREKRSRSTSNDKEYKNDRYGDKYDKYEKESRYKDDRDRYSEKERYDDKKDRKDKYNRDDKYKDRDDKYGRDDREKYKKSKHREEEKSDSRSKDRRR
ncbi:unnamed protein product [Acanthoscelides obtectus]|uniref:Cyclin-L1 n=1 Tax=Acanthoscelides obtectus TaxID=200917 RepID=A0A9P0NWV6_ACAOB|nr:unnamed protein product [Acanthoscelides obtectus]CAK1641379.1 Cyclin-L2 [Acanthoscelides obtectus]